MASRKCRSFACIFTWLSYYYVGRLSYYSAESFKPRLDKPPDWTCVVEWFSSFFYCIISFRTHVWGFHPPRFNCRTFRLHETSLLTIEETNLERNPLFGGWLKSTSGGREWKEITRKVQPQRSLFMVKTFPFDFYSKYGTWSRCLMRSCRLWPKQNDNIAK